MWVEGLSTRWDDTPVPKSLEQRLWESAVQRANELGLSLDPKAEAALRELIVAGVEKMKREGVAEREEDVRRAEENLRRLVVSMAEEEREADPNALTLPSFNSAYRRLFCGIWPFC